MKRKESRPIPKEIRYTCPWNWALSGLRRVGGFLVMGIFIFSCEDEPILTPSGGTTGGSYGRLIFPDSLPGFDTIQVNNPTVF